MDRSHQSSLELRILDLYIPKLKTARSCIALIMKYHLLQLCPSLCKQWLLGLSPFPFPRTKKKKYKLGSIALYTNYLIFYRLLISEFHIHIKASKNVCEVCCPMLNVYCQWGFFFRMTQLLQQKTIYPVISKDPRRSHLFLSIWQIWASYISHVY